jgi:transposase
MVSRISVTPAIDEVPTMTLHPRDPFALPTDIAAIGAAVLPSTNPYRLVGDQLADLLTDIDFAPLYTNHGRAAISPALLALVTILQYLEDVPDRQAAELVRVRLDWKYALHLPVTDLGFDFSCLCYFRRRLVTHQQEQALFDLVLARIRSLGLIKQRGKQRTDSIAVVGAVRELSRLELVSETLRLVLRTLEQTAPLWAQRELPASFREQYVRRVQDYRLSEAERQLALQQTGQDGAWLLERLGTAPPEAAAAAAVGILRHVWEQQYCQQEGVVSVRADTVDCTELVVTPHDPGVRVGEKRGHTWRGEKAHVTETAEPDRPNFITDVTTTGASEVDSGALATIRTRERGQGLLPSEQYVDAGYVTGRQLAESTAEGIALLGPALPDTSPNTFKIADFALDWEAHEARCPAGQTSVKWRPKTERDGSTAVQIQFAAATCAVCPLKPQCTAGASGRSLHINEHHALVAARRAEAQTETFRHKLWARSAIEATLSELVRAHGFRRHRYRGDRKRHAENLWKATACNLKRLVWVLQGQAEPLPSAAAACLPLPRSASSSARALAGPRFAPQLAS